MPYRQCVKLFERNRLDNSNNLDLYQIEQIRSELTSEIFSHWGSKWDKPSSGGVGGRELPYERGGDARRLAQGINFWFWSHLECSGQNAIIFSRKGLF